jgi:diguanylate cyclase (GGDEF)-like protein
VRKSYNKWLYYGLGQDDYKKCMNILFPKNIIDLIYTNIVVVVLSMVFMLSAMLLGRDFIKAEFHSITAIVSLCISILSTYKYRQYKNGKQISNRLILALILVYYTNVMFIGFYLAVWYMTEKIAGIIIGIIICVLFPYVISPVLYFCLTFAVMIFYIITIILFKSPIVWLLDIQNALFAVTISLIFGWQIIMHRMTSALNISKLEIENTTDALTQLKNRRDFMQTFQRYISYHRPSDKFLCIAILDIDCFKNYNDHYGHPKGDECLYEIGKILNNLQKDKGVYTARIGGEEFAMLWHIENHSEAGDIGIYVNKIIRDLNIPHEKSIVVPYITVSIGIHIVQCGIPYDINVLYNLADKSLYNAKNNGRNCTIISS